MKKSKVALEETLKKLFQQLSPGMKMFFNMRLDPSFGLEEQRQMHPGILRRFKLTRELFWKVEEDIFYICGDDAPSTYKNPGAFDKAPEYITLYWKLNVA